MATKPQPISKNILVCAREKCHQCEIWSETVPSECPYAILHLLETRVGGRQVRDRQTGKTTELLSMANDLAEAGYPVVFISPWDNIPLFGQRKQCHHSIKFLNIQGVERHLEGLAPSIILADDITNEDMKMLDDILRGSIHFVFAHYFTPR